MKFSWPETKIFFAALWEFCIQGVMPFGKPMQDDDTPNFPPPVNRRIFADGSPARAFPSGEQDSGLLVTVISHMRDGDSVNYHVHVTDTKTGYYLGSDFVQPVEGSIFLPD